MSKVYKVRMECLGFKDYAITARNEKDAIDHAHMLFVCDSTEAQFGELLDPDEEVYELNEVYYPETLPNEQSSESAGTSDVKE